MRNKEEEKMSKMVEILKVYPENLQYIYVNILEVITNHIILKDFTTNQKPTYKSNQ